MTSTDTGKDEDGSLGQKTGTDFSGVKLRGLSDMEVET